MAKQKPDLSNIFAKTEPEQPKEKDEKKPVGIALYKSEWDKIEAIGAELGVNRHKMAAWALRDFIARWDRGDRPPTETKTILAD